MSDDGWKFEFHDLPATQLEPFKQLFTGYDEGLVRMEPGGFVMPPSYARNAEKIYRMQPRSDDVWLLTFPKCGKSIKMPNKLRCYITNHVELINIEKSGTTWTCELLWLLQNNCDFEAAGKTGLTIRTPFLEYNK